MARPVSSSRAGRRATPLSWVRSTPLSGDDSLGRAAPRDDVFPPLRSSPDAAAPTPSLSADDSLGRAAPRDDVFPPRSAGLDAAAPTPSLTGPPPGLAVPR